MGAGGNTINTIMSFFFNLTFFAFVHPVISDIIKWPVLLASCYIIYHVMEENRVDILFTLSLNVFPGHPGMQHSSILSSRSKMDQVWYLGEPPSSDSECDGNNPDQHQHLGNSKQIFGSLMSHRRKSKRLLLSWRLWTCVMPSISLLRSHDHHWGLQWRSALVRKDDGIPF